MKTLFISAKSNIDISPVLEKVKLKGKIGLVSTVQYLPQLDKARGYLKDSVIAGQVLGCTANSAVRIKDEVDVFLYIGSGEFHPIKIFRDTKKPVYIANPETNRFYKLDEKELVKYERRKKGNLIKFYNAKKVGILVSLKPGQYHPKRYLNLKGKMDMVKNFKADKEYYTFLFDTLDERWLENFPEIECWVNTACPRIEWKNIINIADLK